jgi:hypothetical protein
VIPFPKLDEAFAILDDPMSWMVMSGGAGVGWAFYLGLPSIVQIFLTIQAEEQIVFLTERQQVLVGEWGEVITTQ